MRSIKMTFLHSKFLLEGSQRVGVSPSRATDLEYSAFIRPDGSVVLIILNRYRYNKSVWIHVNDRYWTVFVCLCVFLGHSQWSSLKSGIQLWATSPPLLQLIRCSHLLGTHTNDRYKFSYNLNHIIQTFQHYRENKLLLLKCFTSKAVIIFSNAQLKKKISRWQLYYLLCFSAQL